MISAPSPSLNIKIFQEEFEHKLETIAPRIKNDARAPRNKVKVYADRINAKMKQQRGSRTRESDIATQSDTQEEVKNSAGAAWDNPSKIFSAQIPEAVEKGTMEGIFDTIPNTNKRAEIVHEETCELPSKSDGFHTPPRAISIMAPPSRSKYAGSSPTTETHERNKDEERREIRALYSLGAPEIDEVNQSNTKAAQKAGCTSSSGDQKEESKTSAKVLEVDNNIVSAWDHLSKISSQKVVQDPQNSEMQDYANHLYVMFPPVPKNDPSNHPRYQYPPGEWEKFRRG